MATNNTNRVTKDTSARKQPNMISESKVAAIQAAHQAYIESVETSHQNQIEELEATHIAEITSIKTQLEAVQNNVRQELDKHFDAGVKATRAESSAKIAELNASLKDSERKFKDFKNVLSGQINEKNAEIAFAKGQTERVEAAAKKAEVAKDAEIRALKKKVAIEVTFKCNGRGIDRIYLRRPGTLFTEAVEELCKAVGKPIEQLRFYYKLGTGMALIPGSKNLEQVCLRVCFLYELEVVLTNMCPARAQG